MENIVEFISIKRAALLENSINWLSLYKGSVDKNIQHVVGETKKEEDRDIEFTNLLLELGEINKRREEIIKLFVNKL